MKLTRDAFIGPWAGVPVAWHDDDTFDEATYRRDVAHCCAIGVPGVYTAGTTGEFYAMELDEWQAVTDATIDEARAHGTPVMIGCTSTYTRGVLRRARHAVAAGADAIQVTFPFWMPLPERCVVPFFEEIRHAVGELPISIYETTRAKNLLTVPLAEAVCAAVPTLMMVKANAGTLGAAPEGCTALSRLVNVFVGEDLWAELGPHGATGACSAWIYRAPKLTMALWQALRDKDWAELNRLSEQLKTYRREFGNPVLAPLELTDSAIDRLGGIATGHLQTSLRCRGPYPSADPDTVRLCREWFERHMPDAIKMP